MSKALTLIKTAAKLREMTADIKDAALRTDILVSLDDPAVVKSAKELEAIGQLIAENIQQEAASDKTIFGSYSEALKYAQEHVYPRISACFRLFKTAKLRQDEYIVVNRDWLYDLDAYQTYATDRDVTDRLVAAGIPVQLMYWDANAKQQSLALFKLWRQDPSVQDGRLNSLEYMPGGPDIIGHRFNTFKDVSVPAMEGVDVSFFLDHVRDT